MLIKTKGVIELNRFVPPGHSRIIPFRVHEAWAHDTGTWLSIQSCGPAMGIVWRTSDDYAATPMLADVVCESLDFMDNFKRASELAKFLFDEGPPQSLLESAKRSKEARSAKAQKAALAKHAKRRAEKVE